MSIESFHRSLQNACDSDPFLARLRDITKIEEPSLALASGDDPDLSWPVWNGNSLSATPAIA